MKKKKSLYALSALLMLGGLVAMTGCGGGDTPDPVPPGPVENDKVDSFTLELSGSSDIYIGETVNVVPVAKNGANGVYTYTLTSGEKIVSVNDNGTVTGLAKGSATISVTCLTMVDGTPDSEKTKTISVNVVGEAESSNGKAENYVASSYEDKLDILGKLEKYAVDNHLTGITLFENGGYVMYNSRIEKPVNQYITGYGYGILSEGRILTPMSATAESNADWRMYYHSFGGSSNKQNFNYLDDTGSESADLYGYISSTYYGQKLNATKDGYDWYPVLAKENPETGNFMPQALNPNKATGLATEYKVYVRTEADGLVYNTLSDKPGRSDYVGLGVKLEDYATPFMLLLNGNIGLARNTDYTSDSNNATLKGARAFSELTKGATDGGNVEAYKDTFKRLVGLELNEKESSITFTFNTPVNQFTAMTNLSSSLNSPIPLSFVKMLGSECKYTDSERNNYDNVVYAKGMKEAYGTTNDNNKYTPVDNVLSLAPYVLEAVDDTYNVYKRNDRWFEFKSSDPSISSRYSIAGIKICYLQGAASEPNYAFEQFINAGSLDAVSIPKDYMNKFVNDPRTTVTEGDSTFKLNLNTCTQDEWDVLFEEYKQTSPYTVKPLMSNDNFITALSYAIDRETYATARGSVPSQDYFAPSYLWEPEKGLSYNETPQHKAAIAEYSPETYGYNIDVAVTLMDQAISEEIDKRNYTGYNDSETIDIWWMNTTDTQEYGLELVQYFNDAFERTNAYQRGFRIKFENHNGTANYQDVYDRMKRGEFDLGFGSISGMQLDPLGFMEVLKSDNSSGFTLNYGIDTSVIDESSGNYVVYDGKKWSYDGLWTAATKGALIDDKGKVEKEPVTLNNTGKQDATVAARDGSQVAAWEIAMNFRIGVQASGVSFKAIADADLRENEYVTVTISYTPSGSSTSQTAVINATLDELFKFRDNALASDGTFNGTTVGFSVFVPKLLNENSTFGQYAATQGSQGLDLASASKVSVTIYATYYMNINDVPVATTLTSQTINLK